MEKVLVTAALPYINGAPHLGHIVGCHLPADIFARFQRMRGAKVIFLGGTDEHGTPIELAARKVKMDLEKFKSIMREVHRRIYEKFEISYDVFGYTSSEYHEEFTKNFFLKLYEKGFIFSSKLRMFYCEHDRIFLPGRYVRGTCRYCGYENANGDQCENCGRSMDVDSLIDPVCTLCGRRPVVKETKHLFFDLPKIAGEVKKWLKSVKKRHKPLVVEHALSWVKELKPRCITRDIKNGVPVPLEGFEGKTLYVWFDALLGYISFLGWKFGDKAIDEWWKDKNVRIYHFLGKDNIPFHAVFWPAMLLAHGEFNLPYQINGLAYLLYEGKKFSKSRGYGVFCEKILESDIDIEELRFYLAYLIPENSDTNFSWEDFRSRVNRDLIGNISNFVWRTLHFAKKVEFPLDGEYEREMEEFMEYAREYVENMEKAEIRKALGDIVLAAGVGNAYLNKNEPWKIKEREAYRKVVYNALEMSRMLGIMMYPFTPGFSRRLMETLGLGGEIRLDDLYRPATYTVVTMPREPFFRKIEEGDIGRWKRELTRASPLEELISRFS